MRRFMIRKPNIYEGMSEASFLPGPAMAVGISLLLYAIYYLLREIPANIIDIIYYSHQHVRNETELANVVKEYLSLPGTMIAELLLTSIFMALTLLYVRKIEKRPFKTLGLVREGALRGFSRGYLGGLALFITAAAIQMLLCGVSFTGFKAVSVLFAFAFIVQALSEETVFRGFMLSSLTKKAGLLPAVIISSALFSLLHISNYGLEPLKLSELFVRGILCALIVLRTGSLWGAAGFHAAWNFAFSQASPIISGDIVTNVSAFRLGPASESWNAFSDAYALLFIAAETAVIALVLFAGRNRLVVPLSEEKKMYYTALEAASTALEGKLAEDGTPLIKDAVGAVKTAERDAAKTAALLRIAGADAAITGFSEEITKAVKTLDSGTTSSINNDPVAREAAYAIRKYKDSLAEKRFKYRNAVKRSEVFCPLLRREIEPLYCSTVMQAVDSGDRDMAQLNTSLCKMCTARTTRDTVSIKRNITKELL